MRYLILGCGWVGTDVAKHLLKQKQEVWASTTTIEKSHRLSADGIFAFQRDFDTLHNATANIPQEFDFILVSVPATQKNKLEDLQARFLQLRSFISQFSFQKLIFLSSIGIYPDVSKIIDEDSFAEEELAEKLLLAENAILDLPNAHVYRLGGLFGQNRIFAKYFQHRICTTGAQLANFVHLEDVVSLILQGFEHHLQHQVYNVVAPEHPLKKAVILASAQKYGFELPSDFEDGPAFQKVVRADRLQKEMNYTFKYESPLDF